MAIKTDIAKFEPIEIDITDTGLAAGEQQEMDFNEDWQARACPPPGIDLSKGMTGKYKLKMFMESTDFVQGLKQGFTDPKDPNGQYFKAQITCKIQDPTGKWQDSIVYYNASTPIPKGKKISTMGGLLGMITSGSKVKISTKMSELELAQLFYKVINKNNPVMVAECDWSAWDVNDKKKGADFGTALKVGMKNFPLKKDGTREHIIQNGAGVDCVAKLKILKWIGKPATATQTNGTVVTATAKPVTAPKPVPVAEEIAVETDVIEMADDGEVILGVE